MQSKTSFFNQNIFWKTVSRFWPVWGSYLAAGILALPIVILANRRGYGLHPEQAQDYLLNAGLYFGLGASAVFGLFAAMGAWSFLYNSRSAHGMACLPVRREGVFGSVALAGILPLLLANVVICVLAGLAELSVGCFDLGSIAQAFALASLQLVLFYGLATLCAQLTGNLVILPILYIVVNFVFVGVEVLVRFILSLFVYGLNVDVEAFALKWLSPVVAIAMRCHVFQDYVDGVVPVEPIPPYTAFESVISGWPILIAYAAVGVVLLVCALLLFRRRRMETAGDVVALNVLKPAFRWCMALGCALCLSALMHIIFFDLFGTNGGISQMALLVSMILIMFVGAFVGWFAAEMMMKKSFRVFRGKWAGYGLCCLVIAVLMLACELDLFGFERYVPAPEKVEGVSVQCQGEGITFTEPENVATVCALHARTVANKAANEQARNERLGSGSYYDDGGRTAYFALTYHLRSGRLVTREYELYYRDGYPATYGDVETLQNLLNSDEAIRSRKETKLPFTAETITQGTVRAAMTADECAAAAGYDSAEDYILRELNGLTVSEIGSLTEEQRLNLIAEAVMYNAVNRDEFILEFREPGYAASTDKPAATVEGPYPATGKWTPVENIDLSKVYFNYDQYFTPAELEELYQTCVLPDLAEGTLGRVWIITDEEYETTVYDAQINIHAMQTADDDFSSDQYDYFFTTPTVNSARTNAWLESHGFVLHTQAELNG